VLTSLVLAFLVFTYSKNFFNLQITVW